MSSLINVCPTGTVIPAFPVISPDAVIVFAVINPVVVIVFAYMFPNDVMVCPNGTFIPAFPVISPEVVIVFAVINPVVVIVFAYMFPDDVMVFPNGTVIPAFPVINPEAVIVFAVINSDTNISPSTCNFFVKFVAVPMPTLPSSRIVIRSYVFVRNTILFASVNNIELLELISKSILLSLSVIIIHYYNVYIKKSMIGS